MVVFPQICHIFHVRFQYICYIMTIHEKVILWVVLIILDSCKYEINAWELLFFWKRVPTQFHTGNCWKKCNKPQSAIVSNGLLHKVVISISCLISSQSAMKQNSWHFFVRSSWIEKFIASDECMSRDSLGGQIFLGKNSTSKCEKNGPFGNILMSFSLIVRNIFLQSKEEIIEIYDSAIYAYNSVRKRTLKLYPKVTNIAA